MLTTHGEPKEWLHILGHRCKIKTINRTQVTSGSNHVFPRLHAFNSTQVTKARLIQHYTQVVEIDRLPPPFNLVQWIFTAPFMLIECVWSSLARASSSKSSAGSSSSSYHGGESPPGASSHDNAPSDSNASNPLTLVTAARGFFGRTVFWLMLGPVAVGAGWFLWAVSVLKAPVMVWRSSSDKTICG